MYDLLIKNVTIVNEGKEFKGGVLIKDNKIEKILTSLEITQTETLKIIDGEGKYLLPGVIDDQVHFREPGLIHKAEIYK